MAVSAQLFDSSVPGSDRPLAAHPASIIEKICCACSYSSMPPPLAEIIRRVSMHELEGMIYLTPDELETLTGYKRPADQTRWLERQGVPFSLNARGRPVVRKDLDKTTTSEPELGPVR